MIQKENKINNKIILNMTTHIHNLIKVLLLLFFLLLSTPITSATEPNKTQWTLNNVLFWENSSFSLQKIYSNYTLYSNFESSNTSVRNYNITTGDGTISGGVHGAGRNGSGLKQTVVTDNVNYGSNSAFSFGTGDFTLSIDVKTTGADGALMATRGAAGGYMDGYALYYGLTSANKAVFNLMKTTGGNAVIYATSTVNVNDGNWHTVTGTRCGDNINIYVDGADKQTTAGAATYPANLVDNFYIGNFRDTANGLVGDADNAYVYRFCMNDSQVANLSADRHASTGNLSLNDFPVLDAGSGNVWQYFGLTGTSATGTTYMLEINGSADNVTYTGLQLDSTAPLMNQNVTISGANQYRYTRPRLTINGTNGYTDVVTNISIFGNQEINIAIYNNITNNNTHNFSLLAGRYVNFSVTVGSQFQIDSYIWTNNGSNVTSCTGRYCILQISNTNNTVVINASNFTNGSNTNYWNVTGITYLLSLISPANGSTSVNTSITLQAREWVSNPAYTFQISTDSQFVNIVTSGSGTVSNESINFSASLSNSTKYYWRVRNATGSYSSFFEFTTSIATAVPGQINATVFDEQNYTRIINFTAQLYNSTTMVTKSTTTGWANFSSTEVSSGIYLLRIVPNSSYASRNILITSPTNATVYLPSTTNTINTIAFYLMDYTTLYPWSSSILSITKNSSVMHSAYFDADAKVAAYLIQGDSYGITITNGNNIHNWGNYIAVASGNVEVVVTDIAVNATSTIPFGYNLSHSTTDITLSWRSNVTLGDLNFTILKNNSELVHQLITTIPVGQSQYIVTDLNSTYYVYLTVNNNDYVRREVINYRAGSLRSDCGLGLGCRIMWGSGESRFELPQWMYNSIIVFLIWILAGSFGAIFAAFGAVVTVIFTGLFWYWGWLEGTALGAAFIGGIAILVIIDYLRSRE